jgi:hypothetical protein
MGGVDGLLGQSVEYVANVSRCSPIETKRELFQIMLEMLLPNRALVSPHQPTLQERNHPVNTRQKLGGLPAIRTDHYHSISGAAYVPCA